MHRHNLNTRFSSLFDGRYIPPQLIDLVFDIAVYVIGFEIGKDLGDELSRDLKAFVEGLDMERDIELFELWLRVMFSHHLKGIR